MMSDQKTMAASPDLYLKTPKTMLLSLINLAEAVMAIYFAYTVFAKEVIKSEFLNLLSVQGYFGGVTESGLIVTSGLALGIDGYSHEGALEAGGKVIGVLGSGIDHMTPQRNRSLMRRGLEQGGLVVSEYPPEEEGFKGNFPARNRIISGLSEALVVVEAGLNSGSLITAKHATDQGRTVYAVPGNINSQTSIGCNLLIRDGAIPLIIIDDMIRDIGATPKKTDSVNNDLDSDERIVFDVVRRLSGATMEEIISGTGFSPGLANSLVTVMEIKGVVESYAGRIYLSR